MELLDFLHSNPNHLQLLQDQFAIKVKRSVIYPNLVLLKYDQINSPHNKIVHQCRGIILDEANDWQVVCMSYERFANFGESWASDIDWGTARVTAKEDGSLIQLYYYGDKWNVATSGNPDASGFVGDDTTTFSELFWRVWNDCSYSLERANIGNCYAFELCSPMNKVVVQHKSSRIVLHGVRRLSDLRELSPVVEAWHNSWECIKTYPLKSLEETIGATKDMNGLEQEGFVVVDGFFSRIKVKAENYLHIAHLKDGFSARRLLDVVRKNESSEFLVYFPEMLELFNGIKTNYDRLVSEIEQVYNENCHLQDKKSFALAVIKYPYSGVLFGLKNGRSKTVKDALVEMEIRKLQDMIGVKDEVRAVEG